MIARLLARGVDATLEGTVVLSFSRVGFVVRHRLSQWAAPEPLTNQWIVVTGATSGLGLFTASATAALGANVIVVGRDDGKTTSVRDELRNRFPSVAIECVVADMGSLEDVRRLAKEITAITSDVSILVHNAGAITNERTLSPQGIEVTVASQVVGPFLLTQLLIPNLSYSRPGRVLTVTSGGMYSSKFNLDELVMSPEGYDGVKAYARAKRAQVLLAHEWAQRLPPSDILFATVHPGWTDTPGLAHSLPSFYRILRRWLRTPEEGADTLLWLMGTATLAANNGGLFFDRRVRGEHKIFTTRSSDQGTDQRALWQWCHEQSSL